MRFLHYVCSGLGSALWRIDQADQLASTRELTAERDRAGREEAQAANAAKDAFLAMLGHELRNPLAPMIAAAELLRRDLSGPGLAHLEIIQRQAHHLDRLVEDLLDVSRVTMGKVHLRSLNVDLRDVATKGVEMARPRMLAKSQCLSLDLPQSPVMVDADETRLIQVACNLLNNASDYSPSGAHVQMLVWVGSSEAFLEVRDEGIGIAPGMISRIFELFVQGDRSEEWAPGGLGLGLGVARLLVELHGGTLSALSRGEGLGSAFRVALPLLSFGASDHAPVKSPSGDLAVTPVAASLRRILLVDDNADAADTMGELLRAFGHEVLVAHSPLEALALAAEFAPEVAVLDIGLPVMDGYQLAQLLRERLGAGAPVMIALTGYGQDRDRERSAERGFAAHLVKPTSPVQLLTCIQSALASAAPDPLH